VRWTTDFAQQIRTWLEERRGSRIPTPKEMVSSVLGHIGKKEGRSMIACLKDWLEESLLNSQIEFCIWGHEDENGEPKKGVLGDHLCTLIEPTPSGSSNRGSLIPFRKNGRRREEVGKRS
jgi:hypothetical protein